MYDQLKTELEGRGFSVATVSVLRNQPDSFYAERAQEILRNLQQKTNARQVFATGVGHETHAKIWGVK